MQRRSAGSGYEIAQALEKRRGDKRSVDGAGLRRRVGADKNDERVFVNRVILFDFDHRPSYPLRAAWSPREDAGASSRFVSG